MCKLKSAIALKDRIFMPDYDSHYDMLKELGIEDDFIGASKKFVRVELSPADGYSVCTRGFSRQEMKVETSKHGELLRRVEA